MVEIPIGQGPITAIVFILFEVILLPILVDSTTKASSLLIQREGLKNKSILVKSIPFAPWSDGLLNHRSSMQVLLLIIRIICIVLPVYLETKLIYIQKPSPVQLLDAFVPKSSSERIKFDNQTYLRGSQLASELCTYVDDNDWLVTRVANSSRASVSGRVDFKYMQCIQGTEKRSFRVSKIYKTQNSTWNVTDDLTISGIVPKFESNGIFEFFGTTNVRNVNTSSKNFQVSCLHGTIEHDELILTWHHIGGLTAHIFMISARESYETTSERSDSIETLKNHQSPGDEYRISFHPSNLYFKYASPALIFKFQDAVLFDSRVFIDIIQKNFVAYLSIPQEAMCLVTDAAKIKLLKSLSHDLLYLHESDFTVTSRTQNLKSYTIIKKEIIVISAVEVMCILIFGIFINILFVMKIHSCPPNTFSGVSKAWMNARCSGW